MKSSLPWKYTTTMQSAPSSHLSSWTCLAGCDHMDPGPPVSGAAPLNVCVNLPWTTTPSYAAVCQCQPESIPAGNFCTISEAPSFGFPHTTSISSPGYLGSTGFHGMASLVVKVPWVAPAFAPAVGVTVCAFMFTGMKSRLPWKYATIMQSAPSSHLSSWTCLAGCDHMDPGPPVCGAVPSKVCVHLPWTTTPSYAAVCQCQPESQPAGNFCTISEAPSFGFPHTTDICRPGCLGLRGFHGMASYVVKVPRVAPAFAPAVGVTVPRCCAKDSVVIVAASATTTLVNTLLFIIGGLL